MMQGQERYRREIKQRFRANSLRLSISVSFIAAIASIGFGMIYGYSQIGVHFTTMTFLNSTVDASQEHPLAVWKGIFFPNAVTALICLSGLVSLGVGSIIAGIFSGLYLGISMAMAVGELGLLRVVEKSWLYTPFELSGFLCAVAAGILPMVSVLVGRLKEKRGRFASREGAQTKVTGNLISRFPNLEAGIHDCIFFLLMSITLLFIASLLEVISIELF